MKILIVVPSFQLLGGVSFHFMGLDKFWKSKVCYSTQGHRPHVPAWLCLLPDFISYIFKILWFRPDVVFLNPSFYPYPMVRDAVYLLTAKLLGQKVVCMFHGCDAAYAKRQEEKTSWLVKQYNRCSKIFVLSSDFQSLMQKIGIHVPFVLTTTEVNDALLEDFDVTRRNGEVRNILYLARIDRNKGIWETIKAFVMLQQKYPYLHLNICGNGESAFVKEVEEYVEKKHILGITFCGRVSGKQKVEAFVNNDIYILPSYSEGMPTSLLEAMAFGLPVITRPVGGVPDFFENGKMGYMLDSFDPKDFADKIELLIQNKKLCCDVSLFNHRYACSRFMASSVAAEMESEIEKIIR